MIVRKLRKITIFLQDLGFGGAERVAVSLANYLTEVGIECELLTISISQAGEYTVPNKVNRHSLCTEKREKNYYNLIAAFRTYIKVHKPSLLLIMDIPLCVYAVPAIFGLNLPFVTSERNSPEKFEGRVVTKILSRLLASRANGIVFQTKGAKDCYGKRFIKKSKIIQNPVIPELLIPGGNGIKKKEIVAIGRLEKQKNHELLIQAFSCLRKEFSEYKLMIYGEGSQRADLEKMIHSLGLEKRVFLPGSTGRVLEYMNRATLFVLSSDFEGMPNALMEAMALGLPCVATDCPSGGPAALIRDHVNGILVPTNDCGRLAKAMEEVLENKELALTLGRCAYRIRETNSMEKIGHRWAEFLLRCIEG